MNRIVILFTLVAALAVAGAAGAATVVAAETDTKGGDFSNSHANPTVFAQDVFVVMGSQNTKPDRDWLLFDGFATGTERLDFTFTNPGGDWGGLNLRLKDAAFETVHDWWPLLASWSIGGVSDTNTVTVSYILEGYTGPVYVALDFYNDNDFRNGNGLHYSISKIGRALHPELAPAPGPAPVPLPAPTLLALAGLGSLLALRQSRRSA